MPHFLITWFTTAIALLITAYFVPGLYLSGLVASLVAAIVLGLVNAIVRPILILLTLPITLLTLGLFLLVINGISLVIVAALTPGFEIAGFLPAIVGAVVLTVVAWIIQLVVARIV
jgi:putative membrane protein